MPRKLTVFDSCFTDPKDAMSLSVKMLFLNGCCLRIGMIMTICGSWPSAIWKSRPIRLLKVWSVPPSSTSLRIITESHPCISGYMNS